jgi:hypothetical protein
MNWSGNIQTFYFEIRQDPYEQQVKRFTISLRIFAFIHYNIKRRAIKCFSRSLIPAANEISCRT